MKPISLKPNSKSYPEPMGSTEDSYFPTVYLEDLHVDLPEEGEIRFRFSRVRKTEVETAEGETVSYSLRLKAITDICDCEGKDEENNEPKVEKDRGDVMDELMANLTKADLIDESEDDNPDKY